VIVFLFLVYPLATMVGFVVAAFPCAVASRLARVYKARTPFFYVAAGVSVSFFVQLVLAVILIWSPIEWYTYEPEFFVDQLRGLSHFLWVTSPVFSLAGIFAALTFWWVAGRHYGLRGPI
jgi:hypothetical protein